MTLPGKPGKVIRHSLSRSWRLGHAVLESQCLNVSPIDTILDHEGGRLLLIGKVNKMNLHAVTNDRIFFWIHLFFDIVMAYFSCLPTVVHSDLRAQEGNNGWFCERNSSCRGI